MMQTISRVQLEEYRQKTFLNAAGSHLTTPEQAIDYVNKRGFIFFWPVKGYPFPSLWSAVAGDRPVSDEHDDPGHITWGWKDALLDKRVWYYARVLKKKNTLVSLDMMKFFYTLSPNYGEPEIDLAVQYSEGQLPLEAKLVFDALVKNGPLDTLSLRKAAHLTGPGSQSPFNRALDMLQAQLRVLPVAVSEAGAWKYAFVYDLTHRYYPEIVESARFITESQAMDHLLTCFFSSLGAANFKQINSLFKWEAGLTRKSLGRLVASGFLVENISIDGENESSYCIKSFEGKKLA